MTWSGAFGESGTYYVRVTNYNTDPTSAPLKITGAGGSFRAPMAIAVIGGLITSTLLTLLIVPVFYSLLDLAQSKVQSLATVPSVVVESKPEPPPVTTSEVVVKSEGLSPERGRKAADRAGAGHSEGSSHPGA